MNFSILPISQIEPAAWQNLWRTDYPFLQYNFLAALEASHCTSNKSGWQPVHAVIQEGKQLLAAMPLYLKTHSYGEYVFDWAWANAYEQSGLRYYPKLLNAIPFTPSTGPRTAAIAPQHAQELLRQLLLLCKQQNLTGLHTLFPSQQSYLLLKNDFFFQRLGCQFHWFNQNFASFEDFLQSLNSRKRKSINKERSKIREQNIRMERVPGTQLTDKDWQTFYLLYASTYLKRSGHDGYLNEEFFIALGKALPDQVTIVKAFKDDKWIAGALYIYDRDTLYGRYWGALEEFDVLHYECCYYQGIELAIELQVKRFDAGAQGEHKIQRGFTPVLTQSLHYLSHPQFHKAIENHVSNENQHTRAYLNEARTYLPFKNDFELVAPEILLNG